MHLPYRVAPLIRGVIVPWWLKSAFADPGFLNKNFRNDTFRKRATEEG